MGEVREVVLRLDPARGLRDRGGEVPVVAHDLRGLVRRLLERGLVRHGIVARVRSVVPNDLQRLAALHRRPRVLGDHGDAAEGLELRRRRAPLDLDDAHDARHLERVGGVEALHLAAVHRRTRHHRVEHARQPGVDAVLGLPGHDVRTVDELELALADVAELRRILEADSVARRHGHLRGRLGERAVTELAAGRTMHDLVIPRLHFADRHFPLRGGGRFQHLACRRAAAAHRIEEMARAARAVGVLVAEALLVAGRLHDAYAPPVGLELVGDDHRHAGAHALTHFGAMADDADDAVLADRDEDQRTVDPAVRHAVGAVLGRLGADGDRQPGGEHQPAERGDLPQEPATADVGDDHRIVTRVADQIEGGVHDLAPCPPAACLMAARMRV